MEERRQLVSRLVYALFVHQIHLAFGVVDFWAELADARQRAWQSMATAMQASLSTQLEFTSTQNADGTRIYRWEVPKEAQFRLPANEDPA